MVAGKIGLRARTRQLDSPVFQRLARTPRVRACAVELFQLFRKDRSNNQRVNCHAITEVLDWDELIRTMRDLKEAGAVCKAWRDPVNLIQARRIEYSGVKPLAFWFLRCG